MKMQRRNEVLVVQRGERSEKIVRLLRARHNPYLRLFPGALERERERMHEKGPKTKLNNLRVGKATMPCIASTNRPERERHAVLMELW